MDLKANQSDFLQFEFPRFLNVFAIVTILHQNKNKQKSRKFGVFGKNSATKGSFHQSFVFGLKLARLNPKKIKLYLGVNFFGYCSLVVRESVYIKSAIFGVVETHAKQQPNIATQEPVLRKIWKLFNFDDIPIQPANFERCIAA